MCGLLAYFSTDADRVDDSTVTAVRDATDHATGTAPYMPRDAA